MNPTLTFRYRDLSFMSSNLFAKINEIISKIPKGKVATYGQVAALAGNPRAARTVGWVLNSHSKSSELPWQRVINAKGFRIFYSQRRVDS